LYKSHPCFELGDYPRIPVLGSHLYPTVTCEAVPVGLPKRRPSATDKVAMKLGVHDDRGYEIVGNRMWAYQIVKMAERVSVNPY
jgi:hypothetical protein